MPRQRNSHIKNHYSEVGARYDRLYHKIFNANRLKIAARLTDLIAKQSRPLIIADVGGGTGATIEMIKRQAAPHHQFLLVEPFPNMADKALHRALPPDQIISLYAEDFVRDAAFANSIDIMICQEMIHHLDGVREFFVNARNILKHNGMIVIITRPTDVEFPFGRHTKARWKEEYPLDPQDMPNALESAGFAVETEIELFPIKITKNEWLEMNGPEPLFSTLSSLTEEERKEDLAEIRAMPEVLSFNDKIIFLIGKKL